MDMKSIKQPLFGPFMPKITKVGPFLSIKCLNKGPWKDGPGPEKRLQW